MGVALPARRDAILVPLSRETCVERYPSLRSAVDEFLAELVLEDRASTARTYRTRLKPLSGLEIHTHELTRSTCLALLMELQPHLGPPTLRLTVNAWRSFAKWCQAKGYATQNFADVPKPAKKPPKHVYLSPRQLLALYAACRDDTDRLVLLLLATTGLRNAELCGLRWRDVDEDEGVIRVRGKGAKWRAAAPDARAIRHLHAFRENVKAGQSDVFAFGPEALRVRIRKLGERAGIARVHPHRLRHAFAVAFLEASGEDGLSLQQLLGHSTPEMSGYYVRDVRERAALRKQRAVNLGAQLFPTGPASPDAS